MKIIPRKLFNQFFSPSVCWKNKFYIMDASDKSWRWHVGQQYSGMFYNHPFWCFLQRRIFLIWITVGWVDTPVYWGTEEEFTQFKDRLTIELSDNFKNIIDVLHRL